MARQFAYYPGCIAEFSSKELNVTTQALAPMRARPAENRPTDPLIDVVWPLWCGYTVPFWWPGQRFTRNLVSMLFPQTLGKLPPSWHWLQFLPLVVIQAGAICAMMVSLGVATWWRLIVWTIVGVIVYLAYGRKHSRVGAAMNGAGKASPATIR